MVETWRPGAVRRKVSGHLSAGPMPQLHNEPRTAAADGGSDDDAIKGPLGSRERGERGAANSLSDALRSFDRPIGII